MKVNYKSDFELTIQLTAGGVDVAAPSWDWQLRFFTCDRQAVYTVAHIDGNAERCAVNSDGTITAYFDKHGLMPGALRCEFVNLVPDSHYTHDTQMQVDPVELGVELWRGASDGGMDAVTLELAGQVLAEVQALAADLQQKAESGYFDGEPGPQGPQGPPGPAGPGLLVVTVTGSGQEALTADHTAAEILAAHDAGRPVVAVYGGEVYQLASVGASLASFSLASADLEVLAQIDVDGDGGAVRIFDEVQGVLTAGDGIEIDGTTISAVPEIFWIDIKAQGSGYVYADGFDPTDIQTAQDEGKRLVVRRQFAGPPPQYETYCEYFEVFYYGGHWRAMMPIYNPPTNITGWIVLLLDSTGIYSYRVLHDNTPTAGSGNPITSGGVYTALQGKQDVLTFDDAPTSDSSNPVKSGGVFTALQGKADASTTYTKTEVDTALASKANKRRVVDASGADFVELQADAYEKLGTTDAPSVVLPASYTAADEFLYSFTCATDACVVTLPQGVVLADCCDDFSEVAAGVWFQVSIMDGVAAYLCVTPQN